ncbi:MAG: allophanate hydrolase [Xanthobacteraceae bacterium]
MNLETLSFNITALREAYRNGAATPSTVIAEAYRRIESCGDGGIFISLLDRDKALAVAKALGSFDETRPLWGIPFAVKDNIDVAGMATTAACPAFAYMPADNAYVVTRLIEAGAIPLGKTNLDQFATGLVGVRTPYPVPRNSFDEKMIPGGSSSGSAVAVARGLVSFALGTDTAGSGRVPAGLNNIVGLKPSVGALSIRGVFPACRTLDCVSVFALTVDDAYEVFSAAAGYDAEEPYSRQMPRAPLSPMPPRLRVAVPDGASRKFFGDRDSEIVFDRTVQDLVDLGAEIQPIDMSNFFAAAEMLYTGPWVAERYHAMRALIESNPDAIYPVTLKIVNQAKKFSATDTFEALYKLAALKRAANAALAGFAALMVPTYPRPHAVAALAADAVGPNSELGTYTNFVNLLDLCALALPGQFRGDGFPSGVTLIAAAGADALIASIGCALHEKAGVPLGVTGVRCPETQPRLNRATADEIELVVVGAHLSGMVLNHELTARNARFLRASATTRDYKLFALPGGPPWRPGLLRVADGHGSEIATEVWALKPESFADFVARIPAPLTIGTTRLADGTAPKGFLVEAEATVAAENISRFGGWRQFIAHR